jgi:Cu-Zn family superoxide dismutase
LRAGRYPRGKLVLVTVVALVGSFMLLLPRVSAEGNRATAVLRDVAGGEVGVVKLNQQGADGAVQLRVSVQGLAPGFHGFHVHTVGACSPTFGAAGGHFDPAGGNHPGHAGDQPVLLVNENGKGSLTFTTDRYQIADLFDADGSAFIIHAKADNYANIPTDRYDPDPDAITLATGDAGGRVACGVVEAGG